MGRTPNTPVSGSGSSGQQPAQPRARKPHLSDDDFDLDLPDTEGDERDTAGAADDTWNPEDDSDLGLDELEGSEDVGLDTATGLDDATDADLDLDAGDEGERWTTDSDEAGDLGEDDSEVSGGAEYGWLGDDEPPTDDSEFDPDLTEDERPVMDDGGIEGLDDDSDLDGFDDNALPRLDASGDEEVEDLGIENLDELGESSPGDDVVVDLGGGVTCRRLPERCVRRSLLWSGEVSPASPSIALTERDGHSWLAIAHAGGTTVLRDGDAVSVVEQPGVLDPLRSAGAEDPGAFVRDVRRAKPNASATARARQQLPAAHGPGVLLDEDGAAGCYVCVTHGTATLIARCQLDVPSAKPIVIAELDAAFGKVGSMTASFAEGLVTLYVANAAGVHVIEASLDGEDLA